MKISKEQIKKLLEYAKDMMDILDAEEHIAYYQAEKRWYCRGSCEPGTCPAVNMKKLLEEIE